MSNYSSRKFLSPSLIIRREQIELLRQVEMVRAAYELFTGVRPLAPSKIPLWEDWEPETYKLTVVAKAFVYEAATLRQLVVDVARRYPQFSRDAAEGLEAFDRAFPRLVLLRNSQAHLDERLNHSSRGRPLGASISPPHVVDTTIQGTTENGEHGAITIGPEQIDASEQLIATMFRSIAPQ